MMTNFTQIRYNPTRTNPLAGLDPPPSWCNSSPLKHYVMKVFVHRIGKCGENKRRLLLTHIKIFSNTLTLAWPLSTEYICT